MMAAADLLDSCPTSPDSYYLFPFHGNSGWKLVKGNWDDKKNGHDTKDGQAQSYSYDFTNSAGTEGWEVRAARSGRVVFVYSSQNANTMDSIPDPPGSRGEGNLIVIRHLDGTVAPYGHLQMSKVFVSKDEYVPRGRVIALAGNTGHSGGPHLHFDVHPSFTDWDHWVPTMRIAFQDTKHTCWRPQVGDTLSPSNHVSGLTFSALFSPVSKVASFLSGMNFSEFTAAWADLGNTHPTQDMLTFHTYVEGGQRRFTGLFVPGKGGQAFVAGLDFTAFVKEWDKQGKAHNDMIAFRSYPEAGGIRFAGLFRPGSGGQRFISGVSFDDVVAEWRKTPLGGGSLAMAATFDE